MLYTNQTKRAMRVCYDAHRGQYDKSGVPYAFHPYHLAESMPDEDSTVAALLHDVVEDGPRTVEGLRKMGFSDAAVDAVALLTHDPAEPYLRYVGRIRGNPIARTVKIADLTHNSDETRLDSIGKADRARLLKYRMALAILEDDWYDVSLRHWVKRIPLDLGGRGHFTVYYTEAGPKKYSVDFERDEDDHFDFSLQAAEQMRPLLPEAPSLPEALAAYFADHEDLCFPELLRAHGIPVDCFYYD